MDIKLAQAPGEEDPQSQAQAAAAPVPPPIIKNTKPAGLKGPKGTSPRTSYSRVNTGAPPIMDAGSTSQKTMPPRGMAFLPRKMAHVEDAMAIMTERPTLQTMVQAAMEGTINKVDIAKEATIQLAHQYGNGEEKVASASNAYVPTSQIEKLADALSYLSVKVAEGELGPGTGPNALEVSAPAAAGENIDAGEMGQAIPQDQPPMNPKLVADTVQSGKAQTALETNETAMFPEQPVHPMGKAGSAQVERILAITKEARGGRVAEAARDVAEKVRAHPAVQHARVSGFEGLREQAKKKAKDALESNQGKALLATGVLGTGAGVGIGRATKKKEGSAPLHLIRKFAEDVEALNTGKGNDTPPDASASEEDVPAQPAQAKMVASNEAATNYTKRDAKAEPKRALDHILAEPALSKAHDKTLEKVLDHTGEAGVKISSAMAEDATRVAAARALLSKLAADVDAEERGKKKKEKESAAMGISTSPAASLGGMATPDGAAQL